MKNENAAEIRILENNPTAENAAASKVRKIKPKVIAVKDKPTKIFPSQRIAFDKQLDILRAYSAASGPGGKPVSTEDVGDIVKVASSSFSLVNPFFCDIGLLQRVEQQSAAWKYIPSQDVCNFAKAYEWNRETATHKLAPVIGASWFAEVLIRKLSFSSLSEEEAIAELAEKASAIPEYKPQLRLLINYLEAAGLVQRENGMIKMIKPQASSAPNPKEFDAQAQDSKVQPPSRSSAVSTAFAQPTQGVVNFHVDVKINMDEFANWSPARITSFFSGIAQVLAAKGQLEKEASKENTD